MQGCRFVVRYSPTRSATYSIRAWCWLCRIVHIQGRLLDTLETFVYGFSSLLSGSLDLLSVILRTIRSVSLVVPSGMVLA